MPDLFATLYRRGPPTQSAGWHGRMLQIAQCDGKGPQVRSLMFSAPQSPDEPIDSELGLGVRVVAASAARAIALFSGAHVIVGQMMAPKAHPSFSASFSSMR